MPAPDRFSIEVHFVPLSKTEKDERTRRLGMLLLRGALRAVQQNRDRDEPEGLEIKDGLSVVATRK